MLALWGDSFVLLRQHGGPVRGLYIIFIYEIAPFISPFDLIEYLLLLRFIYSALS